MLGKQTKDLKQNIAQAIEILRIYLHIHLGI